MYFEERVSGGGKIDAEVLVLVLWEDLVFLCTFFHPCGYYFFKRFADVGGDFDEAVCWCRGLGLVFAGVECLFGLEFCDGCCQEVFGYVLKRLALLFLVVGCAGRSRRRVRDDFVGEPRRCLFWLRGRYGCRCCSR